MADDPGKTLDSNTNDQPDPPTEIIPVEETEPITPIQQTENMEVHKHPHHVMHKKKWTEYLLEFFMLFLAVFLGFVAENIREHQVEQQRATELAKNLYREIRSDSVSLEQKLASRNIKEAQSSYFIKYVKDSNLATLSGLFYPSFTWTFIQTTQLYFDPSDGILSQLRNSGELRYFKSAELQSKIGELSVTIANVRSRNEREYSYVEFYLRPFTLKYFDFTWYEQFTQHGKLKLLDALISDIQMPFTGKLVNIEKFNRQEAENIASYYMLMLRSTRQQYYDKYAIVNHQVLDILRNEYHLK